jgi:hypothetical protein
MWLVVGKSVNTHLECINPAFWNCQAFVGNKRDPAIPEKRTHPLPINHYDMLLAPSENSARRLKKVSIDCDLAVGGGGISGICAAITAAREGLKVVLLQDRPVFGGNASSEVRLWILGATSHMGNNNRWARESGVIGEILTENIHRNPEGNPVLVDTLLLDFVLREKNITPLLDTTIDQVIRTGDSIHSLRAFCPQNSTEYIVKAPLYCDATGDGIIGFLSGAAFRMGAENRNEFNEGLAPEAEYGELLGHTLYFYSRDTGVPVKFTAPSFALEDITKIPRYLKFNSKDHGCRLWWIEYGGILDTIHDTEAIKLELWKIVYGVWDYIKNSGNFPDAETMTLEWVGMIPGKRESRRFEGDYILNQNDIVSQRAHSDFVSYGGWAMDMHRSKGIYSEKSACNQYHAKGVYGIPYRCMYSRNIKNLFLAGRIISCSHVAFGSTRVMATCGHNAQAVGMAAALCLKMNLLPRGLSEGSALATLQSSLVKIGQYIPSYRLVDECDIAPKASITASSEFILSRLPEDGREISLDFPIGQMIPVSAGKVPAISMRLRAKTPCNVILKLRAAARIGNHTPEIDLAEKTIALYPGLNEIKVEFGCRIEISQYLFVCIYADKDVSVMASDSIVTGITLTHHQFNPAVATSAKQDAPANIGVDRFEFWCPRRRPEPQNIAFQLSIPLAVFGPCNVCNGLQRPVAMPNAWVADLHDAKPTISFRWERPRKPRSIALVFDTDLDHPMESVLMGHPERDMPQCVRDYAIMDGMKNILLQETDNHHALRVHTLPSGLETDTISIQLKHPSEKIPASLFEVRIYE